MMRILLSPLMKLLVVALWIVALLTHRPWLLHAAVALAACCVAAILCNLFIAWRRHRREDAEAYGSYDATSGQNGQDQENRTE